MPLESEPSPVQELHLDLATERDIRVYVKRDDLIHPTIMGNKWRKLKYNLKQAIDDGKDTLVTFGGAYSNHVAAVAAAAQEYGLKSVAYIRGEELNEHSNATLREASNQGMEFRFVERSRYNEIKLSPAEVDDPACYILPEGGTNALAIKGAAEIIGEINTEIDQIMVPYGTGGTMAGLIAGLGGQCHVYGFPAIKGSGIEESFAQLLHHYHIDYVNYSLINQWHFGGYAKFNHDLIHFINIFYDENNIRLDPIYTGKMFFGVWEMIKNDQIASGTKILCVHTGGLQGITGFNERFHDLIRFT